MFDFSWPELALIGIVALVVIGPKDLPRVMKNLAVWVRKARAIAREFQGSLEEIMREAELDDVKRGLDQVTRFNIDEEVSKAVDPTGELSRSLSGPELANPLADHVEANTKPGAALESAPAAPAVHEVASSSEQHNTAKSEKPDGAAKPS